MRSRAAFLLLLGLTVVAGCSREPTRECAPTARYSTARSAPPVQVPSDLSPPNEEEALRLPPDLGASVDEPTEECLESPPLFSGGSRRGAREADRPAEPAQPSDEPVDPDRVIEN
ncbi:MAG TPA: hypothetical protein VKA43_04910 [Gammaproteobacteria bacterium]|nr:hypothetical protein [Gammaproteobacteria bacterium]